MDGFRRVLLWSCIYRIATFGDEEHLHSLFTSINQIFKLTVTIRILKSLRDEARDDATRSARRGEGAHSVCRRRGSSHQVEPPHRVS